MVMDRYPDQVEIKTEESSGNEEEDDELQEEDFIIVITKDPTLTQVL